MSFLFWQPKSLPQTRKSTQAIGDAMKGVTKAMGQMNRPMNLPALQKMEMTSKIMADPLDDALEGDQVEEDNDEFVNQVLDEIGIDINSEAPTFGSKRQKGFYN